MSNRLREEAALKIMDQALKDLKPYTDYPGRREIPEVFYVYVELEDAADMLRERLAKEEAAST